MEISTDRYAASCFLETPIKVPVMNSKSLNFVEASAISAVQMEDVILRSPAIQQCLIQFRESMRTVLGLIAAPGWSSLITLQWTMAGTNALVDVLGASDLESLRKATPEQARRLEEATHRLMKEAVDQCSPLIKDELANATRVLEDLASRCGPFVLSMFESILNSVCIQTWTVLEVLIEDLHTNVIDLHPHCFEQGVRDKHARRKLNAAGSKFRFRRREDFIDAYNFAFENDTQINSAITHAALESLAQVRHLLVHRGGVIDDQFAELIPRHQTLSFFSSAQKGATIRLVGPVVRDLVDQAVAQGYTLLTAVDSWVMNKHLSSLPRPQAS
jgi:hypothetical protein